MKQKVFRKRVYISGLLIVIISGMFVVKLFILHFSSKIVIPYNKKFEVRRGDIKDRNGYILALSIEINSLFANPEEIRNPEDTARIISSIIRMPVQTILRRLKRKKRFIWIKRKLDDKSASEIRKLKVRGLYFKKEYKRVYPHNRLASNVIGFVGIDNTGLGGIEYSCNSILTGRDGKGTVSSNNGIHLGKNILLTIDRFMQYISEKEIEKTVKSHGAKQGVVLVLEVKTGRILALAKYPNFNPDSYHNYSAFARRNFSIIDSFEPGSTLKIISVASMLENRPSVMNKTYVCKGKIDIADVTINCTHIHGALGCAI